MRCKYQMDGSGPLSGRLNRMELWMKKVNNFNKKKDANLLSIVLGWEYCVEAGLGGWQSSERTFHLCRRRRWVRTRIRVSDPKVAEKKVQHLTWLYVNSISTFVKAAKRKKRIDEGWEYARLPQFSYHTTEHTLDLSRRRRWHRKLVNVDPSKRPIFYFADEKKKKKVFF